ncbi:MAG: NAD-dependent epimerase/dehydratase family protein [Nocardioides sp.]|uniref:NAD-dependent epimerase/dehydratase family protein n=1 Tax=Nocardioides sp. TaxID=35761 RepID=UPI0039E25D4E
MTEQLAGWAGQRVLVTGAGGFIGRHLVRRLADVDADVVVWTRDDLDLADRDRVRAAVSGVRPDVVLHLAAARDASSVEARDATTAVNTLSGAWIVEAVPDSCRAVIRLGSSTEYAASPLPMDEQAPLRPRGLFGATKAAGSLLFTAAAEQRGIRSAVLRAFQVYGPGDKPGRFVPTVLAAARSGETLPLTAPGLRRDWVWVGDVVDACLDAATADDLPAGAVLNLGTGVQTTNEELVDVAERVTGRRIARAVGAHPGRSWDTADWVSDPAAAASMLGWKSRVDLAEGLARSWAAS